VQQYPPGDQPAIIHSSLDEFFGGLLLNAAERKKASVSNFALQYVSKVLSEFHSTSAFFYQKDAKIPVLSDLMAEALEADLYRRITLFRRLGDTSLMLSSFFLEALSRRLVDLSYYHQMGEAAYSHLSQLSESENVYDELSGEFVSVSALIHEVFSKLKVEGMSAVDLLNYYNQRDSEAAKTRLKEMGILAFDFKKDPGEES